MGNIAFSIVVLAISLSIDAFGAGVSYGLRKIKIPAISKLVICIISMVYSGGSLLLGHALGNAMPRLISRIIGIAILGIMGLWIILRSFIENLEHKEEYETVQKGPATLFQLAIKSLGITIQVIRDPAQSDIDKSGTIDTRESFILGLALSVDAIGAGIGSALAGFSSAYIPVAVGVFQWLFLLLGSIIGMKLSLIVNTHKKILAALPGLCMICLAILRFRS